MNSEQTTSLNLETVRHIAELSRLALSPEEEILFQVEIEKILNAFHALTQVPLPAEFHDSRSAFLLDDFEKSRGLPERQSALEPTEHISHMRADIPNNSLSTQTFMANTPDSEGVFVRVPAILNQDN